MRRPVGGHQLLGREGGDRHGGGQQEVPVLEPMIDRGDVGHLALAHQQVVDHRDARARLDAGDQTRVHLVCPVLQLGRQPRHVRRPEEADQFGSLLRPRGGDLLDRGAEHRSRGPAHGSFFA